jgi:antitoxin (DNA-binding transcriptional repressor) of toxin-antitoxin stability system
VYVDLAEKGYTVDITNRGRLVAQLIPVREPGSPLERLIAAGIVEPAEEPGGVGDLEPYPPSRASGSSGTSERGSAR